ncbi:MAG: hypothetical protein Kow0025_00840 [Thermodesulfovibrionales bacterium]
MSRTDTVIDCLRFRRLRPGIKALTDRINCADDAEDLRQCARELKKEAEALLGCPDHSDRALACRECRTVASAYSLLAEYMTDD